MRRCGEPFAPGEGQPLFEQAPPRVQVWVRIATVDRMVRLNPLAAWDIDLKIIQLQKLPHLQLVAAFDSKYKFK